MLPDYAVERFVEEDAELRHLPSQALYQHEIRSIDAGFPYMELTLREVGIPEWAVLRVCTEQGDRYVELADERNYSKFLFQNEEV